MKIGLIIISLITFNVFANDTHDNKLQIAQLIILFHPKPNLTPKEFYNFKLRVLLDLSIKTNTKLNFIRDMSLGATIVELQYNKSLISQSEVIEFLNSDKNIEIAEKNHRLSIQH